MVDSMRGHMRQLAWGEPWLFQEVVFPLLQNDRATTDDACDIWTHELVCMLEPKLKNQPRLFERAREGQTTNITAFLFANSSSERQQACLKSMRGILKLQQRIVQQPLASTSDWTRWDCALMVATDHRRRDAAYPVDDLVGDEKDQVEAAMHEVETHRKVNRAKRQNRTDAGQRVELRVRESDTEPFVQQRSSGDDPCAAEEEADHHQDRTNHHFQEEDVAVSGLVAEAVAFACRTLLNSRPHLSA